MCVCVCVCVCVCACACVCVAWLAGHGNGSGVNSSFSPVFTCKFCASKQEGSCDVVFSSTVPQTVVPGDSVRFSNFLQPFAVGRRSGPHSVHLRTPCPSAGFFHQHATFFGWGYAATAAASLASPLGGNGDSGGQLAVGLNAFDERARAQGKGVVNVVRRPVSAGITGVRASGSGAAAAFIETQERESSSAADPPPPIDWKESSKLVAAIMDQVVQYLGPDLQLGIGYNAGEVINQPLWWLRCSMHCVSCCRSHIRGVHPFDTRHVACIAFTSVGCFAVGDHKHSHGRDIAAASPPPGRVLVECD